MKKKILIASNNLGAGGVQKSLISLLQTIDYQKYDIFLLLISQQGEFINHIPEEVKVIKSPNYFNWIFINKNKIFKELFLSVSLNLNAFKYLYFLIKGILTRKMTQSRQELWESCKKSLNEIEGTYDVAIDYNGQMKNIILDKVVSKKTITWIHSDYRVYKRKKSIDYKQYMKLDKIVTVSKTCREIFLMEFPETESKCIVFENISNKTYIEKLAEEDVFGGVKYEGIKILDITRLDPNKGIDIAVKVCKNLIDNGYNIKWFILGEGPERKKIEKLIEIYNLQEHFILLGFKENPYPYIDKADLIVHCSLFEGKSVAIDEAMLLGKPIILTDYPTAKDQITNNVNGLICESSVIGVYEAVLDLMTNKKKKDFFSNNLKKLEKSAFELHREIETLLN